jgi:hypothetical protein
MTLLSGNPDSFASIIKFKANKKRNRLTICCSQIKICSKITTSDEKTIPLSPTHFPTMHNRSTVDLSTGNWQNDDTLTAEESSHIKRPPT